MDVNYIIHANDTDISTPLKTRLISLQIKDSVGLDSDTLKIVLADPYHNMTWLSKNVTLKIWLGYGDDLYYKGAFLVKELDYKGYPDQMSITALAADVSALGMTPTTYNWSGKTLGNIIDTLAAKHSLIAAVSDNLSDVIIPNLYQTSESDLNFLARLSNTHQVIAQVKNGRLLLMNRASMVSVSGQTLPVIDVKREEGTTFTYNERGTDEYDSVVARYREAYQQTYSYGWGYGSQWSYRYQSVTVGSGSPVKTLTSVYASKAEAEAAANAAYQSLRNQASTLTVNFEQGLPAMGAEFGANLSGFIDRINEQDWVITETNHNLSNSGLRSTAKFSRPLLYASALED